MMEGVRASLRAWFFVGVSSWPMGALGQATSMNLVLPDCETGVDAGTLEQALSVETAELGVSIRRAPPAAVRPTDEVLIDEGVCHPEVEPVVLVIRQERAGIGPLEVRAQLSLTDTPSSERARALAIAIAQLVRVSSGAQGKRGQEADAAPSSAPLLRESSEDFPVPEAPGGPAPPGELWPWHLAAFGTASQRGSSVTALLGAGVSLSRRLGHDFRLRVAGEVLGGGIESGLGPVDVLLLGPRAGVQWLAVQSHATLALGPSLDVSFVRVRGTQASTGQLQAPVWETTVALFGRADLEVPLGGVFSLDVGLELGGTLRSVQWLALGQPLAEFSGFAASGSVGVGAAF